MVLTEEEKLKIEEEEQYRAGVKKELKKKPLLQQRVGCGTGVFLIIAFIIIISLFSGGGEKKSTGLEITQPLIQKEAESNAFMLASLEIGHNNPPESLVKTFNNLLGKLEKKCPKEDEGRIADYIVRSREMIEEKGREVTLLQIGNAMDESIPKEVVGAVKCAEVAAALVVLMTGQ